MSREKTYVAIDLEPETDRLGKPSPLHMTLTPPVKLESAETSRLASNLSEKLRGFGELILQAAEEDYFGPHSAPVRVRKFVLTPELLDLHSRALLVVQNVAPGVDTTYTGPNYQPHSTYKSECGIDEGEIRQVREVTILRKEDGAWQRAAVISLGD